MLTELRTGGTADTLTTVEVESDPLNAVIVVVPFESPLNNPVNGFIVPTELFELTQITEETSGLPS